MCSSVGTPKNDSLLRLLAVSFYYPTKCRTPNANTGTVDVSVSSNGAGGAIVNVTYQLTGLSNAGNEAIGELLSESAYAEMMEEWRSMINSSRESIDKHFGL